MTYLIKTKIPILPKIKNIELFDGAFTWHWHNKWDDLIEAGSKFDILEKKINAKFNAL